MRSSPSSASSSVAVAARRTIKAPKRGKKPPSFCSSSSVTLVASPAGSSVTRVTAELNRRPNGVPSSNCSHASECGAPSPLTTRKSARTSLPLAVFITSVNASPSTSSTRSTRGHQRGR
jgi:hypothetical protein